MRFVGEEHVKQRAQVHASGLRLHEILLEVHLRLRPDKIFLAIHLNVMRTHVAIEAKALLPFF